MKATEFVKKFGWERAKREVALIGTIAVITGDRSWLSDLKRLVESHELLGIIDLESPLVDELANELIQTGRPRLVELGKRIKQAIADVEACQ